MVFVWFSFGGRRNRRKGSELEFKTASVPKKKKKPGKKHKLNKSSGIFNSEGLGL